MAKGNYIKLIFGLKIKQMRLDKKLSLSDLASKCGMSVSYLNEIESGKKYPKTDKIASLAEALGVQYDHLVSLKLSRNLTPIEDLLESNILEQLPLDHYGIDINKLIMLMSSTSMQLSALIASFIETAKGSELSQNNFSRTALRTFKEFNDNYFEDLEKSVDDFAGQFKLKTSPPVNRKKLFKILKDEYNYTIDESSLNEYPELSELRAVVVRDKKNVLLLNEKLSEQQKAFVTGKELAYNYLQIKDRSYIYSGHKLNTFDHLLNYFKASYFSTALIINKKYLVADFEHLFKMNRWDEEKFITIIDKYAATPEMIFQRLTNLSSKYLGLNKFFFLRFNHKIGTKSFRLSKEVRLNTRRNPGGYQIDEHYCRRWISIDTIKKLETNLKKNGRKKTAGIMHSKFFESNDEYLSISLAQTGNILTDSTSSLTIGFQIDDNLKRKIKFWNDPAIQFKIVNDTCEKCVIENCKERVAPPTTAEKLDKIEKQEKALARLSASIGK